MLKQSGEVSKLLRSGILVLGLAIIVVIVFITNYINDAPYRELEEMIVNKKLNGEMCDYTITPEEGNYYQYLKEDKGEDIVSKYLEEYYSQDDIQSALWLLSLLPSTISDEVMTSELGGWLIEYSQGNGRHSTNKEDIYDYIYATYYELEDYYISIYTSGGNLEPDSVLVHKKPYNGFRENEDTSYVSNSDNSDLSFNEPWVGKCILSHCDFSVDSGKSYCGRHGCCVDDCNNYKDPMIHCCDTHNCAYPQCGLHRYTAYDSNYCTVHFREHLQ